MKEIIYDMQNNINTIQGCVSCLKDNIKEYQKLNDESISLYDEMGAILRELVGDKK